MLEASIGSRHEGVDAWWPVAGFECCGCLLNYVTVL